MYMCVYIYMYKQINLCMYIYIHYVYSRCAYIFLLRMHITGIGSWGGSCSYVYSN